MSFVQVDDMRIYYERHGNGPAVVFCHGAGSNAATWWQQIPSFAREFTCIAIDHRCFGRSVADLSLFKPDLFVQDLLAVLDAERIDKAALVCQSLGGMAGVRLALSHPARVWAFVSCDSPLAIDHPVMVENVARFLASAQATEIEDRALSQTFVKTRPELAFLYQQINRFNPFVYAPGNGLGWGARLQALSAPAYLLPTNRLRELQAPTLFVVGNEDPVVTPEVVRDVAAYVPRAEIVEIGGAGHSPYFEQAPSFNQAVLDFLRRHAA